MDLWRVLICAGQTGNRNLCTICKLSSGLQINSGSCATGNYWQLSNKCQIKSHLLIGWMIYKAAFPTKCRITPSMRIAFFNTLVTKCPTPVGFVVKMKKYWTEITTCFLFSSSKRVIQCKEARDYKWRFYKFQFVEISFQISLEHGSILPSELGHRTSFVISWGLRSQSELFAPGKERPVKRSAVVSRCRPLKWHSTHACLVLGHFSGKFWIVSIVVDFYLFFFAEKECEEVTFFQHYVVWVRWGVA